MTEAERALLLQIAKTFVNMLRHDRYNRFDDALTLQRRISDVELENDPLGLKAELVSR